MNSTPWHADRDMLTAYRSGDAPAVLAASVEAHLLRCESCRLALAAAAGPGQLADSARRWEALADTVDQPRGSSMARSALATPTMRLAWLAAMVLVFATPLVLSTTMVATATFLALAPLAPLAAVALAYRDVADPAGELSLATPAAGLRLVAARAVVVALPALPLGAAAALLLGLPLGLALAWLLPGLALAMLLLLAGTTRLDPVLTAGVLALLWAMPVAAPVLFRRVAEQVVTEAVSSPALQLTALVVALGALALTHLRRDAVAYRRLA